jgi:hypothetical protein
MAMMTCARCPKTCDDMDPGFVYWEALGDGSKVLCPDCITSAEQSTIDQDMFRLEQAASKLRCLDA